MDHVRSNAPTLGKGCEKGHRLCHTCWRPQRRNRNTNSKRDSTRNPERYFPVCNVPCITMRNSYLSGGSHVQHSIWRSNREANSVGFGRSPWILHRFVVIHLFFPGSQCRHSTEISTATVECTRPPALRVFSTPSSYRKKYTRHSEQHVPTCIQRSIRKR